MQGIALRILMALLAMSWPVVGQTGGVPLAQTNPPYADPLGAVMAVSTNVLDFGLVGAGRTNQLTLTLRNAGSGELSGVATVAAPFSLSNNAYILQSGQSQTITVRYEPIFEGTNVATVMFTGGNGGTVTVTGYARIPPRPPGNFHVVRKPSTKFNEEDDADLIFRYYSDSTSYILKPAMMEGPYRTICDRSLVLKVAVQQPRHDLAVVVLILYPSSGLEDPIKLAWVKELKALGYERVVFLRGLNKLRVKGLKVLPDPQEPATSARN
jgi:HYDIN/CFA65/VesB-like, Ig-like domain